MAAAGLPAVASGNVRRLGHLRTWTTLPPCAREAAAVVEYLRSRRPAFLEPLHETAAPLAA